KRRRAAQRQRLEGEIVGEPGRGAAPVLPQDFEELRGGGRARSGEVDGRLGGEAVGVGGGTHQVAADGEGARRLAGQDAGAVVREAGGGGRRAGAAPVQDAGVRE